MAVVTHYPKLSGEWLKHELDCELNREQVMIPAATGNLITGTVMGKVTASGKWVPHVNGAADGSEVAAGILLNGVDASGPSDVQGVNVIGNARIAPLELTWDASVDSQTKKDAALAQLESLGFKTAYQA